MHLEIDLACFGNSKGDILLSIDGGLAISRHFLENLTLYLLSIIAIGH
jgi:hypothetical protein